jgi:hypothetical protein
MIKGFKKIFHIQYNQLLLRRMGINTLHGHSPNSVDVNLSEITLNIILLYFVVNHSIGLFYNK